MAIEKISQGVTFKGIGSTMGLVLFVVSIIVTIFMAFVELSVIGTLIGLAVMTSGMMLFLSIRGVLIDIQLLRIKPYVYFFTDIGAWESLTHYDRIVLRYVNESRTMNHRAGSTTHKTRCFEVFLVASNKSELMLKEFSNYDEAKKILSEYAKKLNKVEVDSYESMKEQLQKRRQQVRR